MEYQPEEDLLHDRHKLAGLLNDPKFAHGYVEIADEDAESVLALPYGTSLVHP